MNAVGAVAHVRSSAWRYTDAAYHRTFLRDLVKGDGEAWLTQVPPHTPESEDDPAVLGFDRDLIWAREAAELGSVIDGIAAAVRQAKDARSPAVHLQARHRVYLDHTWIRARMRESNAPEPPAHLWFCALFDLRCVYVHGRVRWHVSIWINSGMPRHRRYRPDDLAPESEHDVAPVSLYRQHFPRIAAFLEGRLGSYLERLEFRVFGRDYQLPAFWALVPLQRSVQPGRLLNQPDDAVIEAAKSLLKIGSVRDDVVARSVVSLGDPDSRLLMLRRVRGNHAHYLVIPGGRRFAREDGAAAMEAVAGRVVSLLTDLEAAALSQVDNVQATLSICRNHLAVYNAVVERGAFLWDAVSTHLPIRARITLSRVHRAVQLLHQFLLQGVADLGHIATLTRSGQADIAGVIEEIQDQFDDRLTEEPCDPGPDRGVRRSIVATGLIEQVSKEGERIVEEARRVSDAYQDLLGAIATAFDERRARESDVMQRAGTWLSASLALLGIVTVLDATVNLETSTVGLSLGGSEGLAWLSIGLVTAQSATLALVMAYWLSRLGQLGGREFRNLYDGRRIRRWLLRFSRDSATRALGKDRLDRIVGHPQGDLLITFRTSVWELMKDTSTDNLERLRYRTNLDWPSFDRSCARELAWLWDQTSEMDRMSRGDGAWHDIRSLRRQVEQWGLHAMMLTERARRLHRYPMPELTCLYRCLTLITRESVTKAEETGMPPRRLKMVRAWLTGIGGIPGRLYYGDEKVNPYVSFLEIGYIRRRDLSAVADIDFRYSMMRVGFTWDEAELIDDWLRGHDFGGAQLAHTQIRRLGLREHMSKEERAQALALVSAERGSTRFADDQRTDAQEAPV